MTIRPTIPSAQPGSSPANCFGASSVYATPKTALVRRFSADQTAQEDPQAPSNVGSKTIYQRVKDALTRCVQWIRNFFSGLFVPVRHFYDAALPSRAQFQQFYATVSDPEQRDTTANEIGGPFLRAFTDGSIEEGCDTSDAGTLTFRASALLRMIVTEEEHNAHTIPDGKELRRRLMKLYTLDHPDKVGTQPERPWYLQNRYDVIWKLRDHLKDVTANPKNLDYLRKLMTKIALEK